MKEILRRARPRTAVASLVALMVAACGRDAPTAPPEPGRLIVKVTTTGGDLDTDGYRLVVGLEQHVVGPNADVVLNDIALGTHALALEGVAENCGIVESQHSATVQAGVTTTIAFSVVCAATGIKVNTHTTGADQPTGFDVRVDESPGFVTANGFFLITRVPPGRRTVVLANLASNCRIGGENPVDVDVVNREVISVDFDITCAATEKYIAFTTDSVYGGASSPWVLVADSTGAGVRAFAQGSGPAWSPDGTKLLFSNAECHPIGWDFDYACTGGLVVMDRDTRTPTVLTNDSLGVDPAWSPDGTSIAFGRSDGTNTRLYVSKLDGSAPMRLDPPGVYAIRNPAWSPDGQSIAFQCTMSYGDLEICVVNADGTGFRRLTTNRDTDDSPAWSPDGSTIAFMTIPLEEEATIVLMTPSGTDIRMLTIGFDPAWSPNGSRLVFARHTGLFTIGSDGSNLKQITTGQHRAPTWRPQ